MASTAEQTALLDTLADAQLASGATPAEFAAFIGAFAGAAKTGSS